MKITGTQSPKRGFSLVEIMIAMTVLAIIFTGAFGALQMGYGMTREARDRTRASQILQTELEAMRTYNWTQLTTLKTESDSASGTQGYVDFDPRGEFIAAYKDNFFCKRKVTLRSNGEQMDIILKVNWDAYPNQKEEIFTTTFTKDGLNDYYYRAL